MIHWATHKIPSKKCKKITPHKETPMTKTVPKPYLSTRTFLNKFDLIDKRFLIEICWFNRGYSSHMTNALEYPKEFNLKNHNKFWIWKILEVLYLKNAKSSENGEIRTKKGKYGQNVKNAKNMDLYGFSSCSKLKNNNGKILVL